MADRSVRLITLTLALVMLARLAFAQDPHAGEFRCVRDPVARADVVDLICHFDGSAAASVVSRLPYPPDGVRVWGGHASQWPPGYCWCIDYDAGPPLVQSPPSNVLQVPEPGLVGLLALLPVLAWMARRKP